MEDYGSEMINTGGDPAEMMFDAAGQAVPDDEPSAANQSRF